MAKKSAISVEQSTKEDLADKSTDLPPTAVPI